MAHENRLAPGTILDEKYLILSAIGHGAMGYVYEAEHLVLLQRVALKVLHPEYAENEIVRERLRLEARILARLDSPHLTRVLDANLSGDGQAYFAMEYVEAEDLATYIADRLPVPVEDAIKIVQQVCHGLESCHAQGIIHRDIKPENILLEQRPPHLKVRLIDFGVAKSLEPGGYRAYANTLRETELGSRGYMAIEQRLDASSVDTRADVYSLGVVLYELLTGRLPFEEADDNQIHVFQETPVQVSLQNPAVPRELSDIILRCLHFEPDKRYASAADLKAALDALVDRHDLVSRSGPSLGHASARPVLPVAPSAVLPAPGTRARLDSPSTQPIVTPIQRRTQRLGRAVAVLTVLEVIAIGIFVVHRVGAIERLVAQYPEIRQEAYEVIPAGLLPARLAELGPDAAPQPSPGRVVAVYSSIGTLPTPLAHGVAEDSPALTSISEADASNLLHDDSPHEDALGASPIPVESKDEEEVLFEEERLIEQQDAGDADQPVEENDAVDAGDRVEDDGAMEADDPVEQPPAREKENESGGGLDLSSIPVDPISGEP